MSTTAIIMLTVSIVTVWGGLAASIAHLVTHPTEQEED
ncbi:MAG: methionine/alanine import family NSS transporter small subunit [Bowdeniella nasicola]|nr:methionine/alanine import family NSS transporter small subunit [Bowdeniella nasicola]